MVTQVAPSARTRSKTRHAETDEQRAIRSAAWQWRATPVWIRVVWGRRVVAWIRGDPDRDRTLIHLGQDHPYKDYDEAVWKKTAGRHFAIYWSKMMVSTAVIDNWYDLWGIDSVPQAGDWSGTARTARQFTGSTTGAMYNGGNVAPLIKYVTRASAYGQADVQSLLLYDRVLAYDKSTMAAGSLAMTNTLPATRYISSGDPGLQIFVEADAVHNATAANMTVLTYVDQSGNTGHVVVTSPTLSKIVSIAAPTAELGARSIFQTPGASTKSPSPYLTLAAGDQGVRSITDYTFSAAPTGTNSFVLQFPFALFPDMMIAGQACDADFIFGVEVVNKRIYDDACLSWMCCSHHATATLIYGWMEFGW